MQIFTEINKTNNLPTAVALGFFDGIHIGHKSVISAACNCKQGGLIPIVYTFFNSPREKNLSFEYLTFPQHKTELIADIGVERLYTVEFDKVRDLSPIAFIEDILIKGLNAKQVFCGFNYHFGKHGAGNANFLKKECEKRGVTVTILPAVEFFGETVSSTRIRGLIKDGKIDIANKMLGHRFCYRSEIIEGRRLGRQLGTPTINQILNDGMVIPKFGVYASVVTVCGKDFYGVTNIGVKPTVGSDVILSETWMPQYNNGAIYGEIASVSLVKFMRPEEKFESIEKLKLAILNDGKNVLSLDYSKV